MGNAMREGSATYEGRGATNNEHAQRVQSMGKCAICVSTETNIVHIMSESSALLLCMQLSQPTGLHTCGAIYNVALCRASGSVNMVASTKWFPRQYKAKIKRTTYNTKTKM